MDLRYNEQLALYADHGRLMGAYGPRLRRWHGMTDQLGQVRALLAEDPDTRRAVVQLFDPGADFRGYKDVPCTLGYRFFLRDGLLHMHTTMRSQDLWLGFCYDIFTATVIQELLAGWLGAGLGPHHHHVDSSAPVRTGPARRAPPPGDRRPRPGCYPACRAMGRVRRLLSRVIAWQIGARRRAGPRSLTCWPVTARWKKGDRLSARQMAARMPGLLNEALCRWYDRLEQGHPLRPDVQQAG